MNNELSLPTSSNLIFRNALLSENNELIELRDLYNKCLKARLQGQLERIKNQVIAIYLESKNCLYLKTLNRFSDWDGEFRLRRISSSSGELQVINDTRYWGRSPLSTFKGNIPERIINELPENAGKKAYVFYASKDPIIAIKISPKEYIGIWKWE
jgi:hypothetical protein